MKKILFLILFLTGLFPVFDSNGLYLGNYRSYGQGELNEIEIVNCTGVSSSVAYETDQYIEYEDCTEEYNYDYQLCEPTLDCTYRTEYKDGSDPCDPDTYDEALCNESNCSTVCPSDMVLNTACECVSPPCTINCPEGQRVTPDCGCEEIPPPSNCRVACLPGYTEINCTCVQNTQPPPPALPDPCAEAKTNDLRASNSIISAQTNTIRANSQPGGNEFGAEQNLTTFPVTNNSPTYMNVPVRDSGYPDAFIPDFTWNATDGYTIGVNHGHLEGTGPSSPDIFKAYEYLSNPELVAAGQDAIDYFKANFTITTTLQDATYTVNIKDWNVFGTLRNEYYADTVNGEANFKEEVNFYFNKHVFAPESEKYIYAALTLYGNAITITKLEKDAIKSTLIKLDGMNIISSPCPQ